MIQLRQLLSNILPALFLGAAFYISYSTAGTDRTLLFWVSVVMSVVFAVVFLRQLYFMSRHGWNWLEKVSDKKKG
jgi:hypothetical protein